MATIEEQITLTTRGKIAIITLNVEKKLNALTQDLYYRLSCLMREVATRDDIYITILTGKGRYFSAYALYLFYSASMQSKLTLPPKRCRRNLLSFPPGKHLPRRYPPPLAPLFRSQQPRNNPSLLLSPQNHHRPQWPRRRPIRRSHLFLGLYIRSPSRFPPYPVHIPRLSRRRWR